MRTSVIVSQVGKDVAEELAKALKKQGVDMHVTALVSLNLHVAVLLNIRSSFLIIISAFIDMLMHILQTRLMIQLVH